MNAQQIKDKARTLADQIGNYPVTLDYRPLIERLLVEALTEAAKPLDLEFPEGVSRCKRCDSALMFSARRHNTGLCHPCAHLKYADIIQRLSDIFRDAGEPNPPAKVVTTSDTVPAMLSNESIIPRATAERLNEQLQQMNDEPPMKFIIKDAERSPSFQALIDKHL